MFRWPGGEISLARCMFGVRGPGALARWYDFAMAVVMTNMIGLPTSFSRRMRIETD